jgi:hypothetical protein
MRRLRAMVTVCLNLRLLVWCPDAYHHRFFFCRVERERNSTTAYGRFGSDQVSCAIPRVRKIYRYAHSFSLLSEYTIIPPLFFFARVVVLDTAAQAVNLSTQNSNVIGTTMRPVRSDTLLSSSMDVARASKAVHCGIRSRVIWAIGKRWIK